MSPSLFFKIFRANALVIFIATAVIFAVFYKSGAHKALSLGLVITCAYFHALFLPNPLNFFRRHDFKSLTIFLAMLATNIALWFLLRFDPLISLLVWLPAVAGVVAARIKGN